MSNETTTRTFKGTPGEWVVYRGPMNMNGGLNPFFKGIVALLKHSGEDDDIAIITDTDRPAYEYIENAHVMAAAPDLLKALEAALEALGRLHAIGDNHGRLCVACAAGAQAGKAIAKALGEQS